jgi:DNA-binding CsgD family transcriptional regulator
MLQPDNALLCHCKTGLLPAAKPLTPLLRRHGIWLRSGGYNRQFHRMMERLCPEVLADPTADPHRFWPSGNGGVYLAVMRWNAEHCTVHFYEEPDPTDEQRLLATLTEREIEVLRWMAQGKANASIAGILGTSEGTVRKHVQNLLAKLHRENRVAAVALYHNTWARYANH